ncbi:hypothetical protein DFJ74DRAFT_675754 [Hyaloraphidium curvatum]|nr:hypothetical protein DFJ74DRAFT_675754 [Hyaloraphidium curvatum]
MLNQFFAREGLCPTRGAYKLASGSSTRRSRRRSSASHGGQSGATAQCHGLPLPRAIVRPVLLLRLNRPCQSKWHGRASQATKTVPAMGDGQTGSRLKPQVVHLHAKISFVAVSRLELECVTAAASWAPSRSRNSSSPALVEPDATPDHPLALRHRRAPPRQSRQPVATRPLSTPARLFARRSPSVPGPPAPSRPSKTRSHRRVLSPKRSRAATDSWEPPWDPARLRVGAGRGTS